MGHTEEVHEYEDAECALYDKVVELHRRLYLILTITTEIVRECYYDTRLGELVKVLTNTAFSRQDSWTKTTIEGAKPIVIEWITKNLKCADTILKTLSEGKW